LGVLPAARHTTRAAGCDDNGRLKFVCGVSAPEDLVAVPGTEWVLVSGLSGGGLHLVSSRNHDVARIFPSTRAKSSPDTKNYPRCPGPLDPKDASKLSAHGLNLRPGRASVHTVYVVHHGARESIEVFELDVKRRTPTLTWVGCAIAPDSVGLNAVAPLPGGGFVATSPVRRGDPTARGRMQKGETSGEIWEWQARDGWQMIPGSEAAGPNGIEASGDGEWLYVNVYALKQVMRLSRGRTPVQKDLVAVPFHPDNIRWQADGSLLTAGHAAPTLARTSECLRAACPDLTSNVARIDPKTMTAQEIVRYPSNDDFFGATAALQVGREVWMGSVRGDRIARYRLE
jgi:hypothetical protein